jgi:molybdopterin-guanine dinucleotide biosynthesis protein A
VLICAVQDFRNLPSAKLEIVRFYLSLMLEIEGFILVGGASSRMGRDKARLVLQGRSFVEHIASALSPVVARTNTVGAKDIYSSLTYRNVADIYEGWGALGGLHAALAACEAHWAAVVACDLPFVTADLFARLKGLREEFDAVVPVQRDGRLQPLCALYRTTPCREQSQELIREGERRPRLLVERVRARLVKWEELADLADADLFFRNVNTPEDYTDARAHFGEEKG